MKRKRRSLPKYRSVRIIEKLEERVMLAISPLVSNVFVRGESWTSPFITSLQPGQQPSDGFSIPSGGSVQMLSLPWSNVNQIGGSFRQ